MKATLLSSAFVVMAFTAGCSMQANRTAEDGLTDAKLQSMVKTRFQGDASISRMNLGVQANAEKRAVELSGTVYTQRQRTRAVDLAKGVREGSVVEDKIDVKPYQIPRDLFDDEMMSEAKADAEKMGDKMGTVLDDAWLHTKIVSKLVLDSATPERKINVDVMDQIVTLRGNVPSSGAKMQAGEIAKAVEGVKSVDNRLMVKP